MTPDAAIDPATEAKEVRRLLALLQSVVRSGEPWSSAVEGRYVDGCDALNRLETEAIRRGE